MTTPHPPKERAMTEGTRTDFENLEDGYRVRLIPNETNPLHKRPINAIFNGGYFYCEGSNHAEGPDYYFGDVWAYNDGFEVLEPVARGEA